MEKVTLNVEGMSCNHCVNAITKAVGSMPGVTNVSVDLPGKTVAVAFDPNVISIESIALEIDDQGYEVVK